MDDCGEGEHLLPMHGRCVTAQGFEKLLGGCLQHFGWFVKGGEHEPATHFAKAGVQHTLAFSIIWGDVR